MHRYAPLFVVAMIALTGCISTAQQFVTEQAESQQREAEQQLLTDFRVVDLACDAAADTVTGILKNTGQTTVDASSTTVSLFPIDGGEAVGETTVDLGTVEPDSLMQTQEPITFSGDAMSSGTVYQVELQFSSPDYVVSGDCRAQ